MDIKSKISACVESLGKIPTNLLSSIIVVLTVLLNLAVASTLVPEKPKVEEPIEEVKPIEPDTHNPSKFMKVAKSDDVRNTKSPGTTEKPKTEPRMVKEPKEKPITDNRKQVIIMVLDTCYFRSMETTLEGVLEKVLAKIPKDKYLTTLVLVDQEGARPWDITKKIPNQRSLFDNKDVVKSIEKSYLAHDHLLEGGSTAEMTFILWGSDVNPDNLAAVNLSNTPSWQKIFFSFGHPEESVKLRNHFKNDNYAHLRQSIDSLPQSLPELLPSSKGVE